MMSAPEVMPQTMQSFQYLNYAAQYQQQRLNFANGYHQSGPGLHDTPSVSTMNPVSVSAPSVLDPATQLGHLNAAITKLEPQLPVAPTGHSTPASTSPNQPTQEQSLPMTPPRPNAMEPLVESFYEKDIEEELDEHFKKSQSETKTRRGLIFPASYYQQQTSPGRPSSGIGSLTSSSLSTTPPYGHYSGFPGYGTGPTSFSPRTSATPTKLQFFPQSDGRSRIPELLKMKPISISKETI
ncbi:Oidioi.mRNA.OKI2018_I69.chr2.g7503.t1.cds [Oikopleura dioica]|uniref:Oidioi.mRNA.OKI2018_I69.chr2.g7503.t1.cds n=1 Tax=Oikopleura dioica TaxID=34765 RepID=A0ABN7TD75_OIKDI|nr:Oidioi.mRNA.OKI2018_I69.chr2.g7503.t1.cds [Oikopleura dioica]